MLRRRDGRIDAACKVPGGPAGTLGAASVVLTNWPLATDRGTKPAKRVGVSRMAFMQPGRRPTSPSGTAGSGHLVVHLDIADRLVHRAESITDPHQPPETFSCGAKRKQLLALALTIRFVDVAIELAGVVGSSFANAVQKGDQGQCRAAVVSAGHIELPRSPM